MMAKLQVASGKSIGLARSQPSQLHNLWNSEEIFLLRFTVPQFPWYYNNVPCGHVIGHIAPYIFYVFLRQSDNVTCLSRYRTFRAVHFLGAAIPSNTRKRSAPPKDSVSRYGSTATATAGAGLMTPSSSKRTMVLVWIGAVTLPRPRRNTNLTRGHTSWYRGEQVLPLSMWWSVS